MMTTQKQVEANRRNASKSTGPNTFEGKAASRLNAFRHGLRARTLILPGDDPSDLDQFSADLHENCNPQNTTEHLLVEKMVIAECQLPRARLHPRLQRIAADRQSQTTRKPVHAAVILKGEAAVNA